MKLALRRLASSPGFTLVALATLALGLGLTTTAFSVLNRVLLRPAPFRDPGALVRIWSTQKGSRLAVAAADYFDFKTQATVFEDMAAYGGSNASFVMAGQPPIKIGVTNATANYLSLLGFQPELGRLPSADETLHMAKVALISDAFWHQQYHADPNILGQTIRLNERDSTIIGVAPPALNDPAIFDNRPAVFYLDPVIHSKTVRVYGWYDVVARLKPGVTLEQAQAAMDVVAARLAKSYPDTNTDRKAVVAPFPRNYFDASDAHLTWLALALCGFVLLIACINLANLQVVRTSRRAHEIALRLSLGCSRRRLFGDLLLENILLSLSGGALGLGVAYVSNAFVGRHFDIPLPLDGWALGFGFLLALATGILFGLAPAWFAARAPLNLALKSGGRGATSDRSRHWVRQTLVIVELGLALVLLAGAGFFVSGVDRLTRRDLGWDATHLVIADISLDQDHYGGDKGQPLVRAFGEHAQAALAALPGVTAAMVATDQPAWGTWQVGYHQEGRPPEDWADVPKANYMTASPGWLQVYGLHLLAGRDFTAADRPDTLQVVIVDESMARRCWPGKSPLGQRFKAVFPREFGPQKTDPWLEVVGVVADFHGEGEFYNPPPNGDRFIRPWLQHNMGEQFISMAVRTAGPPGPVKESVRKAIAGLVPDLALDYLVTMDEHMAGTYNNFTFIRRILGQIAFLGLLLAAIGIYGVVANLAAERTREVGIRLALGAQAWDVIWLFLRNGLALAAVGTAAGLVGSYYLVKILGRIEPVLPGGDLGWIGWEALLLAAVAILACWLPARRSTRVNPVIALRSD